MQIIILLKDFARKTSLTLSPPASPCPFPFSLIFLPPPSLHLPLCLSLSLSYCWFGLFISWVSLQPAAQTRQPFPFIRGHKLPDSIPFLLSWPFEKGYGSQKEVEWGKQSKVLRRETFRRQHKIMGIKRTILSQTADFGLLPWLSHEGSYEWGNQVLLLRISGLCLQAVLIVTKWAEPWGTGRKDRILGISTSLAPRAFPLS